MEETLMAAETNPSQNSNQPPPVPPPAPGTHISAGAPAAPPGAGAASRMARPQKEKALNCPRCNSTNTKFSYYNNYSLRNARYFCKTCRRYWTEGGSLRNVPVGGGSRKKKDAGAGSSSAASWAPAASSGSGTTIPVVGLAAKKPTLTHEGANARELELAFELPRHDGVRGLLPPGEFPAFPSLETCGGACDEGSRDDVGVLSALDLLRSTGCYVPLERVQLGNSAAAFALGELRMPPAPAPPSRRFSLDTGLQRGEEESAAGSLLFPFENLTLAADAGGDANAGADQYDAGRDEGGDGGDGERPAARSVLLRILDERWR